MDSIRQILGGVMAVLLSIAWWRIIYKVLDLLLNRGRSR